MWDVLIGNLPAVAEVPPVPSEVIPPVPMIGMDLSHRDVRTSVSMLLREHFPEGLKHFLNFDYCYAHMKDLVEGGGMDVITN